MRDESHSATSSRTLAPFDNGVFRSIWTTTLVLSVGWLVHTTAFSWFAQHAAIRDKGPGHQEGLGHALHRQRHGSGLRGRKE
ncbi:MFS transporter [Ensifer sp. BR816]|uniref:MFS transporter n=1 Tax=Rhizobium sp. (strain BR816) TaxID=1057002 RepID=UPI0012F805E3